MSSRRNSCSPTTSSKAPSAARSSITNTWFAPARRNTQRGHGAGKPSIAILDKDAAGQYLPRLKQSGDAKLSALDAAPKFAKSGNIAPANYFGDGKFYAVNTMQPAYQPSGSKPPPPMQTTCTPTQQCHDLPPPKLRPPSATTLDAKHVNWIGIRFLGRSAQRRPPVSAQTRAVIYAPATPAAILTSKPHHQPVHTITNARSVAHADQRAAHLKITARSSPMPRPAACRRSRLYKRQEI